jgi:ribonuclease HII
MPLSRKQIKYLVIDAMPVKIEKSYKHDNLEIHHFPFGESISSSIAAASIVAKVTRDRLMKKIDLIIPGFQFAQHKGYGTSEHIKIIKDRGASLIHRQSFLEGILKNGTQNNNQQSIF